MKRKKYELPSQLVVLLVSKNPSAHKQFYAKFLVLIIPTQLRHSTPEEDGPTKNLAYNSFSYEETIT